MHIVKNDLVENEEWFPRPRRFLVGATILQLRRWRVLPNRIPESSLKNGSGRIPKNMSVSFESGEGEGGGGGGMHHAYRARTLLRGDGFWKISEPRE